MWSVGNVDSFEDVLQWKLRAAIPIQAAARAWHARVHFRSLRNAVVTLQSVARGRFATAELHRLQAVAAVARGVSMAERGLDSEGTSIASPTRQIAGRRIPPERQGHFLEDPTSSSRPETSPPCRSPLPSVLPRARDAHDCATDDTATDDAVGSEVTTIPPEVVAE